MASALDKIISYVVFGSSEVGILLTAFLFITLNGAIDSVHNAAIGQVDSAISILQDAGSIVQSTADSVDSFSAFAQYASVSVNQSADAIKGMGEAIDLFAASLGAVPYMPSEATAPLYASADEIGNTADYMHQTAASMANVTGNTVSTATGIQALKEDINTNVLSLQSTKKQIDDIAGTLKIGLVLGSLLALLLFALNGLTFYRQLRN
ncbi:MAG: hypothetical protein PHF60_03800 [Candidatus ainarchaeum sp.]|nr:hypothetical protein [Candidatus ainarchaeum sp.]